MARKRGVSAQVLNIPLTSVKYVARTAPSRPQNTDPRGNPTHRMAPDAAPRLRARDASPRTPDAVKTSVFVSLEDASSEAPVGPLRRAVLDDRSSTTTAELDDVESAGWADAPLYRYARTRGNTVPVPPEWRVSGGESPLPSRLKFFSRKPFCLSGRASPRKILEKGAK